MEYKNPEIVTIAIELNQRYTDECYSSWDEVQPNCEKFDGDWKATGKPQIR